VAHNVLSSTPLGLDSMTLARLHAAAATCALAVVVCAATPARASVAANPESSSWWLPTSPTFDEDEARRATWTLPELIRVLDRPTTYRAFEEGGDAFDPSDPAVLLFDPSVDLVLGEPEDDGAQGIPGCGLSLAGNDDFARWEHNLWVGAPWPRIVANGHYQKDGSWIDYEEIPRRPERPEAYAAYRYPVPSGLVASGYDLEKPDEMQRRGKMSAVGHGGVDLMEKKGTPITMLPLEHQLGDAEVIYVGHLFGTTVVTRHTLREGGRKRDYVLIFGHLEEAGEGVHRGSRLRSGDLVGYVGDTDSPEFVHLHLEARRLRDGVDAWRVGGWNINAREISIVSDPRNVLPLKSAPRRTKATCKPTLFPVHKRSWFDGMALSLTAEPSDPLAP
jgi:hypothetical protein